jgi:hypothetical protein
MTNNTLQEFDPFISRKLTNDLDKNEIRGLENELIRNWIADCLVREQILGLLRTGFINIAGWDKEVLNGGSPLFEQAEFATELNS